MKHSLLIAAFTAVLVCVPSADAGLFKKCHDKGCDDCCNTCSEPDCCPDDYKCQCDVESEEVEKSCYCVKSEAICVPPILSSPFDCFRKKHGCGDGCCDSGCDTGCCDADACCGDGCDGCGSKCGGLFSCFKKNKGCGTIRCVKTLKKEKYTCGEKCVYEWSAVRKDCCDSGCCHDGCCDDSCCDPGCNAPSSCCPLR